MIQLNDKQVQELTTLQEIKYPDRYLLYTTVDNGILIPKDKYGIILIADRGVNGLDSLSKLNIGNLVKYLFLPKQVSVYNKKFATNRSQFSDAISANHLAVVQAPKAITKSFILDITPYISFLYNRFNIFKYSTEAIKFINSTIAGIQKELQSNVIDKWIILYILDDKYIGSESRITDRQLYGYTFLKNIMLNNKKTNALGTLIDNIFLCHCGMKTQISMIYDKNQIADYSRIRNIIMKIKPNLVTESDEQKEESSKEIQKQDLDNKQNEELPKAPTKEDLAKLQASKVIETEPNLEEEKNDNNEYKVDTNKSYSELFKSAKKEYKQYSLDSSLNTEIPQAISKAIITKIDDSEFDNDRQIPTYDLDDQEAASKIINPDNDKMFPFLNHTKVKNSNISDVNKVDVKEDKEDKIIKLLDRIVPQLTDNKQQERQVYNVLYNKLVRDPSLLDKALSSYEGKDLHQLLAYINNDHLPYNSRIYPKKDEVDREVIRELDEWSQENGYLDAVGSDTVLNSDTISSLVNSNMHRVMAQKQLTWNNMPQEVEGYIKKLLENNGFQLVSVEMVDKKPPITQIEPTYKSEIRIKIRNKTTRTAQTLVFDVPTLIEGKYHVSGGIKWLFPNVIATLPIFVVKPGRVQFRSSYSAISFQHHATSKSDTVTVFASGVNMPLLIWLLQLQSFDQIATDLGFSYHIYENKKDSKSDQFQVSLPDKENKVMGITITNGSNAKLIKGLIVDLQTLCNKLKRYQLPFDIYSYDEDSEYIQLYNQRKRNLSYAFDQIKKYMIDKRTEGILTARGIEPDLYKVSTKCASISINDVNEDRLGINNTNLRLMDLVPSEIEKALHYAISEYKRRRLVNPDAKLMVNSGWVINELRKQSVLLLYKDGNLTIENAQLTGARIVGPGGFGSVDMVQIADRNIVPDHFGTLDPVDVRHIMHYELLF